MAAMVISCHVILSSAHVLNAQNLVPNPSFECGPEPCEWTPSYDVEYFRRHLCDWTLPNRGTSDIFSTSVSEECWTFMPHSKNLTEYNPPMGSQIPRTGKRFAGIHTYSGGLWGAAPAYREYLQVKLQAPLIPGESYCAEMFVSLAERPKYAANNLGMHFRNTELDMNSWTGPHGGRGFPLPYDPQIVEKQVINDTINWVRISEIFQPDDSYQYLVIGNFSSDWETEVIDKIGRPLIYEHEYEISYYFIDDVLVEKIQPKEFAFEGNRTICAGDTAVITTVGGLSDITWTTASDTLEVISRGDRLIAKPQATTTYRVKGRNCNEYIKDTLTVFVKPVSMVNLGRDTTICKGSMLLLDPGEFKNYAWNNGSRDRFLKAEDAGSYSISVMNEHGCWTDDEITISLLDAPKVSLPRDTLICKEFFELIAGEENFEYQWSTGSREVSIKPTTSGEYWVIAKNRCGEASDTIAIYSFEDIYIPNVLTLNSDNLNERFRTKGIPEIVAPSLTIYDRWGKRIFSDSRYKGTWPNENQNVSSGVYYYVLKYDECKTYKGWIHVLKSEP